MTCRRPWTGRRSRGPHARTTLRASSRVGPTDSPLPDRRERFYSSAWLDCTVSVFMVERSNCGFGLAKLLKSAAGCRVKVRACFGDSQYADVFGFVAVGVWNRVGLIDTSVPVAL